MRLSQFKELMNDEFGPGYAAVIERDLVLGELKDQTAAQAINAGHDVRDVWLAICRSSAVPKDRWQGKNKPAKNRHAEN